MSSELAELCGVHAGDGYLRNNGFHVELDLSGNLDEKEYYDHHLALLFKTVFDVSVIPRPFPSRRTYGFVVRDATVVVAFQSLGFPSGAKTTTVRVLLSILNTTNAQFFSSFLRGLFDTDGTLSFRKYYGSGYTRFKTQYHTYPLISFVTVSPLFSEDILILLKRLGFKVNCYIYTPLQPSFHTTYRITLNGLDNLKRWMDFVGISNPSKLSRYLVWKKFGHCPTHLTFQERQALLNGKCELLTIGP